MKEETKSRVEILEDCFRRYADIPPEVIVKEDVLRMGLRFTPSAVDIVARSPILKKGYRLFSHDYNKREELGNEPLAVPEDIIILGGPYRLRRTNINVRLSNSSPYIVDCATEDETGNLTLRTFDGTVIAGIQLQKQPKYYAMSFEDGTPYSHLVQMTSKHLLFATVLRTCQYWGIRKQCKFCDINENFKALRKSDPSHPAVKDPSRIAEVVKAAVTLEDHETKPMAILITGGAILGSVYGLKEDDFYIRYIEAIKEEIGNRIPVLLQTGPKTKNDLERYRRAGLDAHHANLEVWDEKLFAELCPGKEETVGRQEWIRRLVESVEVLGEGCVTPNLVCGVEMCQPYGYTDVSSAINSTKEGFEYLMSHGVIPRLNHWTIEPNSQLGKNYPPPLEFFIEAVRCWFETWLKYCLPQIKGYGPMGPGEAVLSTSAYVDMGVVR